MRHILDGAKPRRTQAGWLTVFAVFATALLSLAALRVSARPIETNRAAESRAITVNANLRPSSQSLAVVPADKPGTPERAKSDQAEANPAVALENVSWGQAVDGLEPGILPVNPKSALSWTVIANSQVKYMLLVRNRTREERRFVIQCLDTDDWEIPYLIPGGRVSGAPKTSSIPNEYRAHWSSSPLDGLFPSYIITLAPDETVQVPGEFGLYLNDGHVEGHVETRPLPASASPWVDAVTNGVNWLLHPITVRSLTAKMLAEAKRTSATGQVIVYDHRGQAQERSAPIVEAMKSGKQLYARMRLEVVPEHASALPNAPGTVSPDHIAWGKEWKGLQFGLRLPKGVTGFPALSQARFEVLLRNRTDKPIDCTWTAPGRFQLLSPDVFTGDGKPVRFVHYVAGPYSTDGSRLMAWQQVVLGEISLPEDERKTLDGPPSGTHQASALPLPADYEASFSFKISTPDGLADLQTGRLYFKVTRSSSTPHVSSAPTGKSGLTGGESNR